MSTVLDELGISQWKLRKEDQCQSGTESSVDPEPYALTDSNSFFIQLDQVAFTKYQAKDASTLKFLEHISVFLKESFSAIVICANNNDQQPPVGVVFDGKSDSLANFFTLEQLFLYPERKKRLFKQLVVLIDAQ